MKILVPILGESVTEATVAKWLKQEGEVVIKDEVLVELETDKATLEVYAQANGVLSKIYFNDGEDVQIGSELAEIKEEVLQSEKSKKEKVNKDKIDNKNNPHENKSIPEVINNELKNDNIIDINSNEALRSGAGQKITKDDLQTFLEGKSLSPSERRKEDTSDTILNNFENNKNKEIGIKKTNRIPMTRLQKTMAKRLKEAQNTAAMLTTFNEIDMSKVINVRDVNKQNFYEKYNVKLGFMSFFCNAVCLALKEFPIINSQIEENDILYHEHIDLGIAIGASQGLVVPVIRSANLKSFKEIEKEISDYNKSAEKGNIKSDEMVGATFTISNGGVYGSMMSTPIINPPQTAILGLHQIKERAIVVDGSVVVKPIMYVALTYDHRAVSGKEAVSFLFKIKNLIENPDKMLLEL